MEVKEYFEKYGAPDNLKISSYIALSLKGREYTKEIHEIRVALEALDKKALGRYLGRKAGNKFPETKEEADLDIKTGDEYEDLMLSLFEKISELDEDG